MIVKKWWNEICIRGKREKPREKPIQTLFLPSWNLHGAKKKKNPHCTYSIPSKSAALVPEFAVEDLPLAELQPRFLCLQWKTCPWAEHSDDDDDVSNTGLSQGMRCDEAPFIEDLWIAWMPADHTWCIITRADENEKNEMSVKKWLNEICGRRGKQDKPQKNIPRLCHETHREGLNSGP